MGRVIRRFLTTLPLVGIVAGRGNIVRAAPPDPSSSVVVTPLQSVVSSVGNTVDAATFGVTSVVGGLLDDTLDTVSNVLTDVGILSTTPLQVLDPLLLATLHPHPRDPKLRGWQYHGYFNPDVYLGVNGAATLKTPATTATMSARICINLCIADKKNFAIVKSGACYCATQPLAIDTACNKCTLPCPGTAGETTAAVSGGTCCCSSLAIDASLCAGDEECSRACTSNGDECCGGQSITGANLAVTYTIQVTASGALPIPSVTPVNTWNNWGCYWGGVCVAASVGVSYSYSYSYRYAMTLAGATTNAQSIRPSDAVASNLQTGHWVVASSTCTALIFHRIGQDTKSPLQMRLKIRFEISRLKITIFIGVSLDSDADNQTDLKPKQSSVGVVSTLRILSFVSVDRYKPMYATVVPLITNRDPTTASSGLSPKSNYSEMSATRVLNKLGATRLDRRGFLLDR
ncbi:hypothetical protein EK21DRAFT_93109 [Setomelanomma holmii]|uniref:WSC domain-containing protein n=1 Tax=Setomelanomma holmii TaxID=210430 RepID=A0A9P4H1H6_9PLEO|nr:hypothetical protein EK21DRAFT_93109 [Setomelanomma holmii]